MLQTLCGWRGSHEIDVSCFSAQRPWCAARTHQLQQKAITRQAAAFHWWVSAWELTIEREGRSVASPPVAEPHDERDEVKSDDRFCVNDKVVWTVGKHDHRNGVVTRVFARDGMAEVNVGGSLSTVKLTGLEHPRKEAFGYRVGQPVIWDVSEYDHRDAVVSQIYKDGMVTIATVPAQETSTVPVSKIEPRVACSTTCKD